MCFMQKVAQLEKQNEAFALATIIESKGSTPRHIGKMIVYQDGNIEGTIGGGLAELHVIKESVRAIQIGQSKTVEYILNQDVNGGISMHCGGTLKVFIEVYQAKPELVFIGAGHLGYALSKLSDLIGYPYTVIDDRITYCTRERFPNAAHLYANEQIEEAIGKAGLSGKSYVAIFTKDSDDRSLKEVLKSPCPYVGMIGSKKKVLRIFDKLKKEGVLEEDLKRVHAPIGLEIEAETPEEIAISIMAEIIKMSRKLSS